VSERWRDHYDDWKLDNRDDEAARENDREQERLDAEAKAEMDADRAWSERGLERSGD
jgi:hypothetical protein